MTHNPAQPGALRPSRSLFFLGLSALILALVLVGFARTFYLRQLFWSPGLPHGPVLPALLLIHGTVLTSWFVLLLTQSLLVATNRVTLHRRLGIVGIAVAPVVVVLSIMATITRDASVIDELPLGRSLPNLAGLIAFSICVAMAIRLRTQPAHHKRLMIVGSLSILTPATDRLVRWIVSANGGAIAPGTAAAGGAGIVLLLIVALAAYDVRTMKRVHRGTFWGFSAILIGMVGAMVLIGTGVWGAILRVAVQMSW